jgi:FkbM family methyltransferase
VGESGRVFAFEPEPRNFALLQENIELNRFSRRVEAVQAALADTAGQGQLHLHPDNLGDHRLHAAGGERASVAVPLRVGAEALGRDCPPLDLVKIDVQGAETQVVRGLLPVLRASGSSLRVIVELTPFALRAAGSSGGELLELLAGLDLPFAIVDHVEHRLAPVALGDLQLWCSNVDDYPEDEGFMNIFVGRPV